MESSKIYFIIANLWLIASFFTENQLTLFLTGAFMAIAAIMLSYVEHKYRKR